MDRQFRDFELYSRALITSKDVDPVYPFVRSIIEHYGFEPEWFVFCYSTFYSLESAIKMCERMPKRKHWDPAKFLKLRSNGTLSHFNHERRGSCRNPENQLLMFEDIIHLINHLPSDKSELDSNKGFRDGIMAARFHGEWSAFKIAELFEKSLDYTNLAILDLGLDGKDPNKNDGPIGGLRWLYGRDHKYDKSIYPAWNRYGEALAKAWGVGMGEVETCLCKWHKMKTGKYWVGHDIAEFVELQTIMDPVVYRDIMRDNFDERLWKDIETFPKHLRKTYQNQGKILNSEFAKDLPKINALEILISTE